ncbi:MAG: hypothetical protein K5855_06650, partial [Oscillospiraceae bacterium]|nr:hypothetical protein [Oscillospiraceae bacterium]
MKKKIIRLLMMLLCCTLLGIIRTAAADGAAAALSEASATAGEAVELTVSISNNPGLAAWMFELEWDPEALELDSDEGLARVGDGFASGTLLSRQRDGGKLTVSWFS